MKVKEITKRDRRPPMTSPRNRNGNRRKWEREMEKKERASKWESERNRRKRDNKER